MNLSQIEGQLLATQAAVRVLIASHPNRNAAALAVQREIDGIVAIGLGTTNEDDFVTSIEDPKGRLLPNDETRHAAP